MPARLLLSPVSGLARVFPRIDCGVISSGRMGPMMPYRLRDGTMTAASAPFRYVWPSELDLMAQLAGMRARERWSDWRRTPFTSESEKLVGVWEKPA